jgi:hypothetical protein
MGRNLLLNPVDHDPLSVTSGSALCLERAVVAAGRVAALFLRTAVSVSFLRNSLSRAAS